MKTLNKTLSLVLVLVMVLGLFGVASASFTDAKDVKYTEAVDVMTGIGAINGYTDGSIKPTGTITREEAAKLIVYSVLGKSVAEKLTVGATGFSDVDAGRWSAPYISYLVGEKIISGMGDGTFAPTANVTGYQFAKMMLCANGYGAKGEFTGAGWELAVAVAANKAGIFAGAKGIDFTKDATREQAMLYAFNGIQVAQVSYNKLFDQYETVKRTDDTTKAETFVHSVYPKLTTKNTNVDGIAGYVWVLNGKTISSFVADVATLATSKDGTAIADLIAPTKSTYIGFEADSTVVYKLNGAIDKAGAERDAQKRGAIVNFYDEDNNGKYNTISVTFDTVDTVTGAVATKTTGAVTTVTVPGLPITGVNVDYVTGYEGLVKDDVVTYHTFVSAGNTHYAITKATAVTGTLNAYNTMGEVLVIDGKQYKTSQINAADAIGLYAKYATVAGTNFYLDAAGYVVTAVANKTINTLENTVYVVDAYKNGFTSQAQILKADGKTEIVTVAKMAKYGGTLTPVASVVTNDGTYVDGALEKNAFYTFSKNADGSYNLTVAETNTTANVTITKGAPALGTSGAIATNGTVFVYYSTDKGSAQVFTGIANAPTHTSGTYACIKDSNGLATFVVAVGTRANYSTATSANTKYVFPFAPPTTIKVDANTTYYKYNAVVDGVIGTFDTTAQILLPGTLYAVDQFDGDKGAGVVTDVPAQNIIDSTLVAEVTTNAQVLANIKDFVVAGTTVLALGTVDTPASAVGSYVVADNVKVIRYNGVTAKTPVEEISLAELNNMVGDTYAIQATEKSITDGTLTAIYVTVTPAGSGSGIIVNADDYKVTKSGLTISDVAYYTTATNDDLTLIEAIKSDLTTNGYTVTKITFANPTYTFSTTKNSIAFDFTWANTAKTESVKVKVDGTDKLIAKTAKTNALGGTQTTFVKETLKDGTTIAYKAVDGSTTIVDGASYENGFYKITYAATTLTAFANSVEVWTVDGKTITADAYAKAGAKVVSTITTDGTGFTAAATCTLVGSTGATAAIKTPYTVADSGAAPSAATTTVTFNAQKLHTNGASTFTWTVAADVAPKVTASNS